MSDLVSHITVHVATSATTDEQLLESWLDSLNSPHSRRNFEQTARRFLPSCRWAFAPPRSKT